jgi:hypothetical protein
MKRIVKTALFLSALCICSCSLEPDDSYLSVPAKTETVKKGGGNSPTDSVDHTDEPTVTEPTTNEPATDEPATSEPTTEEPAVKVIDWEKTIANTDKLLFEKGCAIYNDDFFKNKKAFAHPEIERSTFYPKVEGLEYTTTQIDRPAADGCNYWYFHYELKHTTENLQRLCNYLGVSQESVIVWG